MEEKDNKDKKYSEGREGVDAIGKKHQHEARDQREVLLMSNYCLTVRHFFTVEERGLSRRNF